MRRRSFRRNSTTEQCSPSAGSMGSPLATATTTSQPVPLVFLPSRPTSDAPWKGRPSSEPFPSSSGRLQLNGASRFGGPSQEARKRRSNRLGLGGRRRSFYDDHKISDCRRSIVNIIVGRGDISAAAAAAGTAVSTTSRSTSTSAACRPEPDRGTFCVHAKCECAPR